MAVKIKFLGGVRTVTGSSHLLSTQKSSVLLDAGLFQGHRDESYRLNSTLSYNPRKLDALILSHAHIDHCGNIPSVIKNGLRCKIYTTHATKDIAQLMIQDSAKIQQEDIRYLNKINRRLRLPLRKPLYTPRDVANINHRFHAVNYEKVFSVSKDIQARLHDAGHILGSASIDVELRNGASPVRVGYAVDLGRKNLPLLNDPVIPKGLDYLIIEATYGGRMHAPIEEAEVRLAETINRTVERGGKIIIPSFSLERTQEVIFILNGLFKKHKIPWIPIYIDSPLAIDITALFNHHTDYLEEEVGSAITNGKSPFDFINVHYVRKQEESKILNNDKRPMVIIAGSGMCESGRILHHLKNTIGESRNTIVVVGYMAKDTLGRRIVEKARIVRIFGIEYELNAEVVVINAFSAHADKNELLSFVNGCLPLKRVFIVHADIDQAEALQAALSTAGVNAYIPSKDEELILE